MTPQPGRIWETALDAVAAIAVVAATFTVVREGETIALALLIAAAAAVSVRRKLPLPSALAALVVSLLAATSGVAALPVWVLAQVVLFSVPLRAPLRYTVLATAAHAVTIYVGGLLAFGIQPTEGVALILPFWPIAVAALGYGVRAHYEALRTADERLATLAAVHEAQTSRRIDEERVHIARDLHDGVANAIAIISIHAGATERALSPGSNVAAQGLQSIRAAARGALMELDAILAVLRDDGPEDRIRPTAGGVPEIITRMRSAGDSIEADLAELPALAPATEAAVYRVVQESLTNAHRHGEGPVQVKVEVAEPNVVVTVTNRTSATTGQPDRTGLGLVGMRERVERAGGHLVAEDHQGEFVVNALLPLGTDDWDGRS